MRVLVEFENTPLLFQDPYKIISCSDPAQLASCFQEMEEALRRGFFIAGFFSYEAGYAFEHKLRCDHGSEFPLLCFGCYAGPRRGYREAGDTRAQMHLEGMRLNISRQEYDAAIRQIRAYIRAGEVYQITYCLKLLFSFPGSPFALYRRLLREQPVPYPAYVETDHSAILSLSPEMFMKKRGRVITTKPMKGTWPRGGNPVSDLRARLRLHFDEKNRAENVMIADLLRNDLGRIGTAVRAPRLFEVNGYTTLFQMTSTVTAEVEEGVGLYELFGALFPSGSVTGAPKIRAMQIIRTLEAEERKIYTGAIGYISPAKDVFFNIPIRTLLIGQGQGEMGIGGGIVWDSTPEGEWAESRLKAKFLTDLAKKPGMSQVEKSQLNPEESHSPF